MISGMEKARVGILVATTIQVIGLMIRKKVKAFSLGLVMTDMR